MPDDTHAVTDAGRTALDRLLLAFTELTLHGIAAEDSVDDGPARARAAIAARLRVGAPHGLGSYVFWVRADEARAGSGAGLPLHTSGPEVDRAVVAACAHHGLAVRLGPRAGVLLVGWARSGRPVGCPGGGRREDAE